MARPIKENVEYFPFICKEGKGMHYIQTKYKNDGYATWIKILRMLAVTNNHWMNLSNPIELMFLASTCLVTEQTLVEIITDLATLDELDEKLWKENRIIWSQKLVDSIQDAYGKRSNKCMTYDGLLQHLHSLGVRKLSKSELEGVDNTQSIVKYSKVNESKVKQEDETSSSGDKKEKKVIMLFEEEKLALNLPFNSPKFVQVWNILIREPKWLKKSVNALKSALIKLDAAGEVDSVQMMLNTIEGGWQGLFELKGQQNTLSGKKDGLGNLKNYANGK